MNEINIKLCRREAEGRPIMVGLVGAGQMGTEIVTQIGEMKGMETAVVVDLSEELAMKGYAHSRKKTEVVITDDLDEAERALAAGKRIASTNYLLATRLPAVDAVVDATGSTNMGVVISLDCMSHGKHIVMMSVECDITVGPILRHMADNAGVVYSLAAGDEPAAIVELFRFADALGFEVIAAGKGKNNPLNIYATPETERENAERRKMSANMLCEFVDGSKTAIEMASVSNATGLIPDRRGMHAAKSTIDELNKVFVPKEDGGILTNRGIVDFAIGVHPGVFLIVSTNNDRIKEALIQRDMGQGPYYTLFRPFHLCSIEVPLTVAQCVLYGESSGHPRRRLTSECIAVAKKDLKAGETLDGIGEYCYRGIIERHDIARKENLVPLGLVKSCVLSRDVPRDEVISYDMIKSMPDSVLLQLRKLQDNLPL
ncbi:MAG: NAD(P)-dependent oxidoreductase [bacterium]|nr:MAG: NAD(P)-dependent oxidoreductase [bacterium]